MARVDNTAEGGSNGTTVTTGNSGGASGTAFSAVSIGAGCTFFYTTSTPILDGSLSWNMTAATAANAVTADLPVSANANGSIQALVYWNTLPSGTIQGPITVRGGGATQGRMQTNSTGNVQISLSANGSFSSGNMVSGVIYRVEFIWYNFNTANSVVVCNVYSALTGVLVLTCSHFGTTTANVDTVRIGKNGGTATLDLKMDRLYTDTGKFNEFGIYPNDYLLQTWGANPINTRVEIYTGAAENATRIWRNIVRLDTNQAGVYGEGRSVITISRGRTDETRGIDASTCSFQINNRDGRFSPRNPMGVYFGHLNKNTPVRVSVPGEGFMQLNASTTSVAIAPDSTALSIVGDIDVRVNADIDNWWVQRRGLLDKYNTTGNQRAYQLVVNEDGYLEWQWSTNGTLVFTATSTVPVPFQTGRWSVRLAHDVNNGASGNTAFFYYSADTDLTTATWTLLDTVITASTTSIFDSSADVYLGDNQATDISNPDNYDKIYAAQIRNGIAGTVVANPEFSELTAGTAAFHDRGPTVPNVWTLTGSGYIEDRDYRFFGEITDWPTKWDTSGEDCWVDVTASGPMVRLGQSTKSELSAMRRSISRNSDMTAYWPVEDGEDATVPSTGAVNGINMVEGPLVVSDFAAYNGTFKGTETLALIDGNAWGGTIKTHTLASPAAIELQWLMNAPAGEIPNSTCIMRLFSTGTAARWDIVYTTASGGALEAQAFDSDGASILTGGATAFAIDGKDLFLTLQLLQNGTSIDWELRTYQIDSETSTFDSGTLASRTVGRATGIHVNPPGSAGADDVAYGQLAVFRTLITDLDSEQSVMADAYRRESACNRINRLCTEERITFHERGARGSSTAMGYQLADTVIGLLQEAAESDGGWLYEDRERLGLVYRTRASMYAADTSATLDVSLHEMLDFEAPDGPIINDVTVSRVGGSSYRAVLEDGRLSIEDPPDGVGTYDQTYSISLGRNDQPPNQAGWRLSKGTVDEPRYVVALELAQNEFFSSATKRASIRALDIGQRLDLINADNRAIPDDCHTIVQGYEETLSNLTHSFKFYTQPYYPWQVGYYSAAAVNGVKAFYPDDGARYESLEGTVTSEILDLNELDLNVTNPREDVYFTHADGDYDILINGEQMTVTAVAGTGIAQVLTLTRHVNGISKVHASGSTITLFIPEHYGI